jgi:GPH family glycoside/pentoside/hexuronide:cation symporter
MNPATGAVRGSPPPPENAPPGAERAFGWRDGWRYGLLGFPLAFVALPLYVVLPNHYARAYGIPLATLGAVLLAARLLDALVDPLLGRLSDRLYRGSVRAVLTWGAGAAVVLGAGFAMLFFPPVQSMGPLLVWMSASLLVTYVAFSLLSILHQSWGAMLGGDEAQRGRIVAWREALGLLGVILASVAPVALGLGATTGMFVIALALGWWAWSQARRPRPLTVGSGPATGSTTGSVWQPFRHANFRALLAVFVVNGIASAVPATLILFFVQDRLQAPESAQPLFLGSYFLCAAVGIPAWLWLVRRIGLGKTWGAGMLLAVVVFIFAAQLGAGDTTGFLVVCMLSGLALGTDLALPSALLAGAIQINGDQGRAEGAYFGWWNFATKLNLALAAGVALPVLGLLGYTPGAQDPQALQTLTLAYCVLPCALKLLAATLLYTLILRKTP